MLTSSQLVAGADGTPIAVSVYRPDDPKPVGVVMRATRYWRFPKPLEAQAVTDAGLALVLVDVRGTGASFGTWVFGWGPLEIADLSAVVDWIVTQPWSNGAVGAYGTSYDANAALLLAAECHPAVKIVIPRFFDYDPFSHITHPGGVFLEGFLREWGALVSAMDRGDAAAVVDMLGASVDPATLLAALRVDEDANGELLTSALRDHTANMDVAVHQASVVDPDDAAGSGPRQRALELETSHTLVWAWGSWYDAGTAAGAIELFRLGSARHRATLLASNHGGAVPVLPIPAATSGVEQPTADEQLALMLDMFTAVLARGQTPADFRTMRFWVSGEERWHETQVWPPPRTTSRQYHLGPAGALVTSPTDGEERYDVDFTASTGQDNRWHTQLDGRPVRYGNRVDEDAKLLTWTSQPIAEDLFIVGDPRVALVLATSTTDAAVHVYLEAVAPDLSVHHLTEGHLRLRHRGCAEGLPPRPMEPGVPERVEIAMLPLAVRVPRGHSLRLGLAGHDAGTFARIPVGGPATWTISRKSSSLRIPYSAASRSQP